MVTHFSKCLHGALFRTTLWDKNYHPCVADGAIGAWGLWGACSRSQLAEAGLDFSWESGSSACDFRCLEALQRCAPAPATHLGELLLQPAALTVQLGELALQRLPCPLHCLQGALQALPLHLLLQPLLLHPLLLLPRRSSRLFHLPLPAQQDCLLLLQLRVRWG